VPTKRDASAPWCIPYARIVPGPRRQGPEIDPGAPSAVGAAPAPAPPPARTVAELLEARSGDERPGLHWGDTTWSWRRVVAESRRRAVVASALRRPGPFHIGVLLGNVSEYLLWLGAAALAGATIVGINPTRRGAELARDIRFTDCQLLVTDDTRAGLLEGLDLDIPEPRILRVDSDEYRVRLDSLTTDASETVRASAAPQRDVSPEDLLLLLFTSGTTGDPKAVRCTQGRLAAIAGRAAEAYGFERDDICYCPMPLFHGNAIMALWAPALAVGASVAVAGRFSASRFVADVRHFGATRFHLRRQGPRLRARHPGARRRRRQLAAPRIRHRGLGPRPCHLRAPIRLSTRRGVRIERRRHLHQRDARHPTGVARPPSAHR